MNRTFNSTFILLVLCLAALAESACAGPKTKGHLFIIGGGHRSKEMMRQFVDLAGGTNARVVVLPNASGEPDTAGMEMAEEFRSYGVASADWILMTREEAMNEASTKRLDGATGIYFTGGDQSRLTAVFVGTPVHKKLRRLYLDGAVVGGTSAGAAVMSKIMITGNELLNKDTANAYISLKKGNIETADGLGFLDGVIIDQHFVRRKRHNRLVSLVLENPKLIGIGIDEATAIIVNPDNTFRVTGTGSVIVYDARNARSVRAVESGNLAGYHLAMSILVDGDRYFMASGSTSSKKK